MRALMRRILKKVGGSRIAKTPILLQMEAVECGAAALGIVLGYYGKFIPLEELRVECGVSRDGSKAGNILKAARKYKLKAKGFKAESGSLLKLQLPLIIHWNFNHFLVVEGFAGDQVFLNDPASGRRTVSKEEFDQAYTGIALVMEPDVEFTPSGERFGIFEAFKNRLAGSGSSLVYLFLVCGFLVIPGLLVPSFTRIFIDDILLANKKDWLWGLLFGMGIAAGLQIILTRAREYYLVRFETKLSVGTSSKFLWHLFRLPIQFFAQRQSGDILSRMQINDQVAKIMTGQLAATLLDLILVGFFLLMMFFYDVTLTLIGIFVAVVNIAFLQSVSSWRVDQNMKHIQEQGKLAGVAMGGLQIIETVKANSSETDLFNKVTGHQIKLMNIEQALSVSSQMLNLLPGALVALNENLVLILGSYKIMTGQMTVGTLMAFQVLVSNFLGPINRLVSFGQLIQELDGDLRRLDDVLKYPQEAVAIPSNMLEERSCTKLNGYLEFRNVTFGYNQLEPPLIEGLSFCAKPGKRIAFVGFSGSGKSTVAKLAAGLYQPWSGEILFDGKGRQALTRELIHNSLATVDQDIYLFAGTIRENLTMWDETIADSEIIQAAEDAMIQRDIATLAGAYEYKIDEGGRNFSGGQRQRFEIARALVINPTILILDEATSALDPLVEFQVMENIQRRGCTCIMVAHRLSTIRDCDEIIVLDKGKVVQRGTHQEMIAVEGPYKNLISSE